MRLSKYVNMIKKGEYYVVFHSHLGEACVVDQNIWTILKKIDSYKLDIDNKNVQEIVSEFTNKGFIVEDDKNYLKEIEEEIISNIKTGAQIQTIQLIVSNNCNFNCKYCFEHSIYCSPEREKSQNDISNKIMDSEDAIDYIQKILQLICGRNVKRHLHIQFFGGEPLTNKDAIKAVLHKFEDGVRYGVELSYSIVTNGSLIDNEMAELFSKYNVAVIVSFDNPNKSDRIMKSGNNSIDKTKEVLKILQRFDAYVAFNSVLSEYTYDYFDTTIIDFAFENNVQEVGIVLDLNPDFYNKKDYKDIAKKILDIVDYGNKRGILVSGYWMSTYLSVLGHLECKKGFKTCSGTGSQLSIEPNGTIFSCKGSSAYYGHVNDLQGLLEGEKYRRYVARSVQNSPKCEGCEISGFCSGFCLGPLEQTYGDISHIVEPYCDLMRYLTESLLLREESLDKYEY